MKGRICCKCLPINGPTEFCGHRLFALPIARMGFAPLLHPLHLLASSEVIAVGFLTQPLVLTGGLAGLAAVGTLTVTLVVKVAVIRTEKLVAMAALTPSGL